MGESFFLGIRVADSVVLVADKKVFFHGAITLSSDKDKSYRLTDKTLMLCCGEAGDPDQFGEYVAANLKLYKMKNGYEVTPRSAAHFARKTIADNLRSYEAYLVFVVIGGVDADGGYLCSIDHLGNPSEAPYLAQGFAGRLCLSILDKTHRSDWSQDDALDAAKLCIKEVKKRFAIGLDAFKGYVIDNSGIRELQDFE